MVERHEWASDGRWLAIGSKNRTVHVFATNPCGGKTEEQNHLKGRVFNYTELVSNAIYPAKRPDVQHLAAALNNPLAHREAARNLRSRR